EDELAEVRRNLADQQRIFEDDLFNRLRSMLLGKVADGGPKRLKAGSEVAAEYLDDLEREKWFDIRLHDENAQSQLESIAQRLASQKADFERQLASKKAKITQGDELAPGVLKMVKVYLAVKRRIQP